MPNQGPLNKDIFGKNYFVKGKRIIDEHRNITGNSIQSHGTLRVHGCMVTPIKVGEDVTKGDILVPSTILDRAAVKASGDENIKVIGVACSDALSGKNVDMVIGGEFQVKVTGNVNRGDFLETTNSADGVAIVDTDAYASFAIAMETDLDSPEPGTRLIWARFIKSEVY